MKDPNRNQNQGEFDKSPNSDFSNHENIETEQTGENNKPDNASNASEIPNKLYNIIIHEDKRKDRVGTISNIISGFATIVAAVTFFFTYLLFKETRRATDAAIRSVSISESALKLQKINDSINFAEYRLASVMDSINTVKRFKIDSASLQGQIASLNQVNKIFQIDNEPYLEIQDPVIDTIHVGHDISWKYFVRNLGKSIVKEDSIAYGAHYIRAENYNDFVANPFKYIPKFDMKKTFIYVNSQIPQYTSAWLHYPDELFSTRNILDIKERKAIVFLYGRIVYTSSILKRKREYVYIIRMTPNAEGIPFPSNQYDFIYNENRYIK